MRAVVTVALVLFFGALVGTSVAAWLDEEPASVARRTPAPSRAAGTPAQGTPVAPGEAVPSATAEALELPPSPLSYAGIAQHAMPEDCWIVVRDRVYDVTAYLDDHPGGEETITPWCGQESTVAFETEDGAGTHSRRAYADLEDYYIGDLEP
jgi:cytochrome b involved in lipid metabolism